MVRLYTTFYNEKNPKRAEELTYCLVQNSLLVDQMTVFVEGEISESTKNALLGKHNVTVVEQPTRTSFNQVFERINVDSLDATNFDTFITCNTDICIHNKMQFVDYFYEMNNKDDKKYAMALSRWDYNYGSLKHFDRPDSQDTWAFCGPTDIKLSIPILYGTAGCDNRLAHELKENGYEVINPSKKIVTVHHHVSNIRNYLVSGRVVERVEPPYHLITPTL